MMTTPAYVYMDLSTTLVKATAFPNPCHPLNSLMPLITKHILQTSASNWKAETMLAFNHQLDTAYNPPPWCLFHPHAANLHHCLQTNNPSNPPSPLSSNAAPVNYSARLLALTTKCKWIKIQWLLLTKTMHTMPYYPVATTLAPLLSPLNNNTFDPMLPPNTPVPTCNLLDKWQLAGLQPPTPLCSQHRLIHSALSTVPTPLAVDIPYIAKANPVHHPNLVQLSNIAEADNWLQINCSFDHDNSEVRHTNAIQLTSISPPTIIFPAP